MGELEQLYYLPPPPLPTPPVPPPPPSSSDDPPPAPPSSSGNETNQSHPPGFDPSRMIGIIRRKALIKDLAAVCHAECLSYSHELLELQIKSDEQTYRDVKIMEKNPRKETARPSKRMKKTR